MSRAQQLQILKENPIFQMSLASKELFHSNFLYWLSIYDKNLFKNVVDTLTNNKVSWTHNWIVLREDNNYDLSIRDYEEKVDEHGNTVVKYQDYLLVVENKVKSIVTHAQLNGYYNEVSKINKQYTCVFCLLTLVDEFLDKPKIVAEAHWQISTYVDLARILENVYITGNSQNSTFNLTLIEKYIEYIKIISDKSFFNIPQLKDEWNKTSIDSELKEIRIDDLRQKAIAHFLAKSIYDKLKDNVVISYSDKNLFSDVNINGTIYLSSGYSNGRALVHLSKFIELNVLVRFEIEGDKYKRGVIIQKPLTVTDADWKTILPMRVQNLFSDDFINGQQPHLQYPSTLNGGCLQKKVNYGTYDMANLMKYQSVSIPSDSTLEQVVDAIVQEIKM